MKGDESFSLLAVSSLCWSGISLSLRLCVYAFSVVHWYWNSGKQVNQLMSDSLISNLEVFDAFLIRI